MGYEFIQTVGNYKYIYFIEGHRENGKVKQKRTPIGKLNATGQKIYKPEYLEKLQAEGQPLEIYPTDKLFSIEDVKKSTVRSYGLFHFLSRVAERVGLTDALQAGSPDYWQELFMLSCYMVSSGEPAMYCADWLENNESFPVGSMTSQRISELLLAVKPQQREKFFQEWRAIRSDDEFLALDITSQSSWSKLIEDVEYGYNPNFSYHKITTKIMRVRAITRALAREKRLLWFCRRCGCRLSFQDSLRLGWFLRCSGSRFRNGRKQ